MRSEIMPLLVAAAVVALLALIGLPEQLGAHPFWGVKTGLIGAVIGAVAGALLVRLRLRGAVRLVIGGALLAAAFLTAKIGAARFAASYAEDAFGGKMWFFGWIGAAAGLTLFLSALLGFLNARR